jgi:hypothetical protein
VTGPILDAAEQGGRPTRKERYDYALDADPSVMILPFDFTCNDVRHDNDKGGSATAMVIEREKMYRQDRSRLAGAGYCTAMYPELWNIYGPLADAVFAKPYRLGFGHNPRKFIEEEEEKVENARLTAQPRPWLYTPESFKAREIRMQEGEEVNVLAWVMLVKGAKGIRYHYWKHLQSGFFENRRLQEAVKSVNRSVGENRERLSVLIPAEEIIQETPCALAESKPGADVSSRLTGIAPVKVYTAWGGDRGMLVVVRNLDYETEVVPDDNGEKPCFRFKEKYALDLPVILPEWMRGGDVRDLTDGSIVPAREILSADGRKDIVMRLDRLPAFRVLWVENK